MCVCVHMSYDGMVCVCMHVYMIYVCIAFLMYFVCIMYVMFVVCSGERDTHVCTCVCICVYSILCGYVVWYLSVVCEVILCCDTYATGCVYMLSS